MFFKIPIGEVIGIIGAFLGSAELAFAISVVLLGKPFVKILGAKLKRIFLRHKAVQPAKPVGKRRYYIGIVFLLLSFLPWFIAELALFFGYPKTEDGHTILLLIMLSGDAMFIISLFTLGGDFWDRLKNLFQYPRPGGGGK
ncbi:MAG: hypothetical protein ISS61_01225 [Desulfobacteraceae bacterium]|nr:hypothetical protein [Desulfobacteraceae bacterium]